MTDLATVRAEIKSWERSFKETNGRPPSVDDIKQNDAIGVSNRPAFRACLICGSSE